MPRSLGSKIIRVPAAGRKYRRRRLPGDGQRSQAGREKNLPSPAAPDRPAVRRLKMAGSAIGRAPPPGPAAGKLPGRHPDKKTPEDRPAPRARDRRARRPHAPNRGLCFPRAGSRTAGLRTRTHAALWRGVATRSAQIRTRWMPPGNVCRWVLHTPPGEPGPRGPKPRRAVPPAAAGRDTRAGRLTDETSGGEFMGRR